MELTFVHQYSGDTPKRRRLAKACETCRARKKRCIHYAGAESLDASQGADEDEEPERPNGTNTNGTHATTTATSSNTNGQTSANVSSAQQRTPPQSAGGTQASQGKRFFSDLIPEATFLNRARPVSNHEQRPPNEDIGVWVDKREWEALVRQRENAANDTRNTTQLTYQYGLPGDQRPHSAVLGPLIEVYFKKTHPILPIVDEAEFKEHQASGDVPEPLVHAMCLVAAKDSEAGVHLRIQMSPSTLPPREFCCRLHASVLGALRAPCQYDKVTLVRILALASLHSEGNDGAEESSMLLSQAMHHAQTMGIHLGQQTTGRTDADLSMKRLFWCLWALDRANSTINGRPVIMSDVDIAIDRFEPGESGFPAFDAWIRITEILNKVIAFYRPHYPTDVTGWEDQYPGLEEILDDVGGGWQLPHSVQVTVHLYYLVTAILSHRSRGIKQIPRGTNSSIRQRLCASEVVRLMESDYAREVHALPFIPYAVSLALSVAYQHLRQSQFQHQQEDACLEFSKCTKILQSLRRTWSSADTMAALARKVQDEIERAPSLASFRVTREAQRRGVAGAAATKDNEAAAGPCISSINGERTGLLDAVPAAAPDPTLAQTNGDQHAAPAADQPTAPQPAHQDGVNLFDGIDDVFGTYLDPNYPVNLDDLSFLDDMQPFDYNNAGFQEPSKW